MLALFDPRDQPVPNDSQFRSVVTGRFGSSEADVLAVEQVEDRTKIYLSRGAMGGELEQQVSSEANAFGVCKSLDAAGDLGTAFCIDDARYIAWPEPAPAQRDRVVAIDKRLDFITFDPGADLNSPTITLVPFKDRIALPQRLLKSDVVVNDLRRVTVSDGTPRLLVSMGPNPTSESSFDSRTLGAVNLCTFDTVAGPVCQDIGAEITARDLLQPLTPDGSAEVVCVDADVAVVAAAKRFEPPDTDSPDLVVMCNLVSILPTVPGEAALLVVEGSGLFRVSFDLARIEPLLALPGTGDSLRVGDVTGDGIDDIVLFEKQQSLFTILRQCNSRDRCGGVELGDGPPMIGGR
jgi:hypothetical protein